jgi:membrane protease YdiL (CAAX protease family)
VILFFLIWALLLAPFFLLPGLDFTKWLKTSPVQARLYADITSAVTILAVTWLMIRFIDRRPFSTIGFAFDHIYRDFLIGIAVGSAWLWVSVGIVWAFGYALPVSPVGFSWGILAGSAISMLFNVAAQEVLLCGFIFQTIRNRSNVLIALLVSAALFAVYHAGAFKGDWLPVVNIFIAGLFFCLAYIITGNLWFPIAIHFSWDVLLGPVLGLTESGKSDLGGGWKMFSINGPNLFTGGSFGLEGGLVVTITLVVSIVLICFFQRQKIRELIF